MTGVQSLVFFMDHVPFKYASYNHHQLLQHHQQSAPPAPPVSPASPTPTGEAQTYIVAFIPDFGCFRLTQQLLRQKPRVFVC
jgi:hypothetical protein